MQKCRGPVTLSVVSSLFWLATLVVLRFFVIGQHTPIFSRADNPTAHEYSSHTRFLTLLFLPALNAWLLLCPAQLSFDWSMEAVPRVISIYDKRNIASLFLYVALYILTRVALANSLISYWSSSGSFVTNRLKRLPLRPRICYGCKQPTHDNHTLQCRRFNNNNMISGARCMCSCSTGHVSPPPPNTSGLLLPLLCLTIPFLPASNMFFYVGFVLAERVLYLPSVGSCLLVGHGIARLWDTVNQTSPKSKHGSHASKIGLKTIIIFGMVSILAAFAYKTVLRNRDWLDDESLYRSGIAVNPPKGEHSYFVFISQ